MAAVYSLAERARARASVRTLDDLMLQAKGAAQRGLILPPTIEQTIAKITDTQDPSQRVNALINLSDRIRTDHLAKLSPLARDDFNAFCEVMNPDEPPESPWHIFLTGLLQEIETDPERDNFILNCPPGHAKPLSVYTLVLMGDGAWKRLGDIVVGDTVTADTGRIRKVTAVHEQGELEVLTLTTTAGRRIVTAPDHSFRTGMTWKQAAELRPGDPLEVIGSPEFRMNASGKPMAWFELAAAFAAQGGRTYLTRGERTYLNVLLWTIEPNVAAAMSRTLDGLGVKHANRYASAERVWRLRLNTGWAEHHRDDFGFDQSGAEKRVPAWVFRGGHEEIGRYLSLLFSMRAEAPDRYKIARLILYCQNQGFADDVQKLLAAMGVPCQLKTPASGRTRIILSGPEVEAYLAAGLTYDGKFARRLDAKRKAYAHTPAVLDASDFVFSVERSGRARCRCLTVAEDHTFLAEGVTVHNSTYASRLFVAWRLGRDPDQRIIGGGHSQRFVENEFSKKIRTMVGMPAYRAIFPELVIDHATRAADQWSVAGRKGTYVARGVGQGVHGFRATFICVDDPYAKIEDAESATVREKVNTWFIGDIGSRVLPNGKIFVIMTRFHEDDLTGYLIELNKTMPEYARYYCVEAPAICYDPENDVLGRSSGEVLWDYYNLAYFASRKISWKYQRFALVYQQLADAASQDSVAGKFQYYSKPPHKTVEALRDAKDKGLVDDLGRPKVDRSLYFRRVIQSVDTATKDTQRSNYTVAQVWGETHDRKHYLLDQIRGKWLLPKMTEQIERQAKRWAVDRILIEDKGNGTAYIQSRGATDSQRRMAPAPIEAIQVPSNQGKTFRWDEITPMIADGDVLLPEDAPWLDLLIREVGQFPDGANDDQVDAMTQYLRWAKSKRQRFGSKKVGSMG